MAKVKSYYKPKRRKSYSTKARAYKKVFERKLRIISFAVLSVFLATFTLLGISIYNFMNAPFTSASNADHTDRDRIWKEDSTTLLVLKLTDLNDKNAAVENLIIANFDNHVGRYYIYHVPVNEEIEYALNYGDGTFRNAYATGNADQERGIYLVEQTILKQLAIKTDGYVLVDDDGFSSLTEIIGDINAKDLSATFRLKNWPKVPSLITGFRDNTLTNLKLMDVFELMMFIRNTSETSSQVRELTRYQLLDHALWDQLWQGNQSVSDVKKEGIKVFIANASNEPRIPGLAGWGARVVENLGASVLETDNAFFDFDESIIITDDPELATVRKLAETLGVDSVVHVNDLNPHFNYNPQIFRTSVSLILVSN